MSFTRLNTANQQEVRDYAASWKFATAGNPNHWKYFAWANGELYKQLPDWLRTEVVDGQPYANAAEMFEDIDRHTLKVSREFADEHPVWNEWENIQFRLVHDWHHYLSKGKFTWVGEKLACASHLEALKDKVRSRLFVRAVRYQQLEAVIKSECLGQTAVGILDEKFPPQYIKEMIGV